MYHVGRPGEDGYTERVLAAWGVDGHNSHTNVCSAAARTGYAFWMGIDRPSPDHANATVIYLISSHLETGHYFNPHAQRIMEAKATGRQADRARHPPVQHRHPRRLVAGALAGQRGGHHPGHRPPPDRHPGATTASSCAGGGTGRSTWPAEHPDAEVTLRGVRGGPGRALRRVHLRVRRRGVGGRPQRRCGRWPTRWPAAGNRLSTHNWRSAAAGNLGGWQVSRTLFLLNALTGAVATPGGVYPNAWNKFVPRPIHSPPHRHEWNELTWPLEYPLAHNELSFLLPHFLKEGRGRLEVYFTRVYNPVWTNPDGFSLDRGPHRQTRSASTWRSPHLERDRLLRRLRPAHGPRLRAPRPPLLRDPRRPVDRLPPARPARGPPSPGRGGRATPGTSTPVRCGRRTSSGSSCRGGSTPTARSASASTSSRRRGRARSSPSTSTTGGSSTTPCPGCPRRAAAEGLTPLDFMRRYGAFEITTEVGAPPRGGDSLFTAGGRRLRAARPGVLRHPGRPAPERRPPPEPRPRPRRSPAGRASWSTAASCGASRPRRAGSSSGRPPSPSGAGRSTPCPATSAARSTRPRSRPVRCRSSPPSGCRCRSTPARPTRSGWTRSPTPTRSGSTPPTPPASRYAPVISCGSRRRSATSCSRPGSPRASARAWWPVRTTWAAGSRRATRRASTR